MTTSQPDLLARALDQTERLLADVGSHLSEPSNCEGWTIEDLSRHVVAAPQNFVAMFKGDEVDWANPPALGDDPAADFRVGAEALQAHLADTDGAAGLAGPAIPEFAVHAWDLAQSLGDPTPLDDEVAGAALAFMQEHLTDDARGEVFGPKQDVAVQASVHDRLAAFAGRRVS